MHIKGGGFMQVTTDWIKMDDGVEVFLKKWVEEETKPRAILQLVHGMAEHIGRYEHFAKYLVEHNIFVYGSDHRGHGRTGEKAGLMGYLADTNGFDRVVEDLFVINATIKKDYPNTPIILFGHSWGSFLSRRYIQKYAATIQGIILSGTGYSQGVLGKIGKWLAKRQMKKFGPKNPSPLMDSLSFGSFNNGIRNAKTKFDWLSRDSIEVDTYMKDPNCGFICTSSFFYDLLTGIENIHNHNLNQTIPKQLPMFIFSGDKDPVGKNTKGVQKVYQLYKNIGLTDVRLEFFKEGRHEMLNELNKHEVYTTINKWITKTL